MPQAIELISKLEKILRCATKFVLHLPFITEISHKERLISLDLLPVCYWHELLDMEFFFTRLCIIWSSRVFLMFLLCAKVLERLEHLLLALLSLSQRDVELQHIRNLFLLEQPEFGTYSLAEWIWLMLLLLVSNLFSITSTLVL